MPWRQASSLTIPSIQRIVVIHVASTLNIKYASTLLVCTIFPPRLRRSHLNCSLLISLHNWVQQALHRRQALVWQVQYRSHCCRRKLFVCWFICHFPPKSTNQIAALNFQNRVIGILITECESFYQCGHGNVLGLLITQKLSFELWQHFPAKKGGLSNGAPPLPSQPAQHKLSEDEVC